MGGADDASEDVNYLDELAASHPADSHYGEIQVVRHYDQHMTCILGVVFDAADDAEVSVSGIVLNRVPCSASLIAVVICDHESVISESHESLYIFAYRNL